jgi:O-antigen ligase
VVWSEHRSRIALRLDVIVLPLTLWILALAWGGIQLVPLGSSGLAHPSWSVASSALGESLPQTISVNGAETRVALMRLLTYVTVFLSAFIIARDVDRANFLLRAVLVAAALYALYGLLRYATAIDKILWFDQPSSTHLTATFVNRNTAATYFGVASCVSFVFLLRRARHAISDAGSEATARRGLERLLAGVAGKLGFEFALFVLLLTATLLTQSRAGVTATLLALTMGLLLLQLRARRTGGGPAMVFVMLVGLTAGLGVMQMSGTGVIERLADTESGSEDRFSIFRDTVVAISDHAWLGTGLGTFQDIFPLYLDTTAPSNSLWDKAHNDYLEVLLGLGIPAGSAIILAVALLIWRALRGTFERRRNSHIPMAGVLSGLLVGVHAVFDFSLQIQAVALTFAVVLAAAVAQARSDNAR